MPRIYSPPVDLTAIKAEITQLRNGLPVLNASYNPILTGNSSNGITVTASSEFPGGYEAWRALDGVVDTKWASFAAPPHSWQIDYGRLIQATAIEIRRPNVDSQCPNRFWIDISKDLVTWTNVAYEDNEPFNTNLLRYLLPPGSVFRAARVRDAITLSNTGNAVIGIEYFGLVSEGVVIKNDTHTFTQNNHGFQPLNVVAWNGTQFVLADKNGPVDNVLVSAVPNANQFEYFLGGKLEINHPFGSDPAILYLGDNGQLTLTPPTTGLPDRENLIMGLVLGAGALFIRPEWRAT